MNGWKALLVAGLVVAGVSSTTTARAEAVGLDLGVFGSYLDADDFKEGYGAGGKLKLNIAEFFAVDVRGSFLTFDDTEVDIIPVEAAALLQIPLGDALNLYGGVGVGYYMFDADKIDLDDNVGYFPLAGAEIAIGDIVLFGEVRWLALSSDTDSAVDEIEGIVEDGDEAEADGMGVNIGISLDL